MVGRTDDVAGVVGGVPKSTAQLFALLSPLGGPPEVPSEISDASVTLSAPPAARAGSKVTAHFTLRLGSIAIAPTLRTQATTTLGVSVIQLSGIEARFGADTSPGSEFIASDPGSQAIDLLGAASATDVVSTSGNTHAPRSAAIHWQLRSVGYRLGINGSVDGGTATIGTLSLTCPVDAPIGATEVA